MTSGVAGRLSRIRKPAPLNRRRRSQELNAGDVVKVIDLIRDAWPAMPVVLLTPKLKHSLEAAR